MNTLSSRQTNTPATPLHFEVLPLFASFLLNQHLDAFSREYLRWFQMMEVPMLRRLQGMPEQELLVLSKKNSAEFLTLLASNNARKLIDEGLQRWRDNTLLVQQDAITAEDITYITFARRKTFLHFLPAFTPEPERMLAVIDEIDRYFLESETAYTNTYVALLQEKISRTAHLLEQVNNTLPGAVYVFDVENYKGVYSNNNLSAVIGYSQDELNSLRELAIQNLVHPDDVAGLKLHLKSVTQATDGEIRSFKYRLRGKDNAYHWVRSYESVFKRNNENQVAETIGITLNIDNEQNLAKALEEREEQYKQAEALANMGHFSYDVKTGRVEWTDQLYYIYGLEPQSEEMIEERFLSFVHPDDRAHVLEVKERMQREKSVNYIFRIITAKGEEKTIRSIAQLQQDSNGVDFRVIGAEQDVTEKQRLIEQLRHSEKLFKQAQALTHVGNWTWNVQTGAVEWSDEVYRIYGIPPGEELSYEKVLSFAHPDDRDAVAEMLVQTIENGVPYEKYHRILRRDGKEKNIHRRAEAVKDADGNVIKLVGTTQDVTERQQLIHRLEESEKLYKQAQEIARLGNWTFDVATHSITWSDEIYKMLGFPSQQFPLSTDAIFENMPGFDRILAQSAIQRALESGGPFEVYHQITVTDGTLRTIHIRGESVTNNEGAVQQLIGTAQDVTQQKLTEQRLRENETFIKKIADATPSIISLFNVHTGRYLFVNEGLKKLLGYESHEVLEQGRSFFDAIIHPDDFETIQAKITKQLAEFNAPEKQNSNQGIVEFTYRMRHQNGQYRWFQTYATIFDRNAKRNVEHVLNISLDITDQIEAQRTIEAQEHFIRHIADASPTILYLFDVKENRFTYINQEIYYVLGYTMDEILQLGDSVTKTLYHPEDFDLLPERRESQKTFQHSDSMMQYECRMKGKEGQWCWLLVREVIFEADESGRVLQILGAALDISKRKDMEKTLLQNSLLLEQSNASLEEFAYVASHDLKEPLRKISTFGDRLIHTQLERLADDGKIYLRKIVDASQRMQLMINDLLSVSMITGDRSFQNFSLQTILEEVLQTLEFKIEQKAAVIEAGNLPDALIVPSQFRQLFQNLISNSLKFIKADVPPRIGIKHSYLSPEEAPTLEAAMRYLKLEFTDNGIGFEEEYAGKIFAIFQRLHGRSEYEGTGIGLAICKKIVEHHGGIIYAHAKPGQGATFTVVLPA